MARVSRTLCDACSHTSDTHEVASCSLYFSAENDGTITYSIDLCESCTRHARAILSEDGLLAYLRRQDPCVDSPLETV